MAKFRHRLRQIKKALRSLRHPLSRKALKHGVAPSYEHFEILKGLNNIKCPVDVGANVGQFSLLCKIVHPNAHIHAFEPLNKAADADVANTSGPQPAVVAWLVDLLSTGTIQPIHDQQNASRSGQSAPPISAAYRSDRQGGGAADLFVLMDDFGDSWPVHIAGFPMQSYKNLQNKTTKIAAYMNIFNDLRTIDVGLPRRKW